MKLKLATILFAVSVMMTAMTSCSKENLGEAQLPPLAGEVVLTDVLATDGSSLKNRNVYEDDPTYQIVYFGKLNEADQVVAENLYKKKEELKALFLLRLAVPVIPLEGVGEKTRYAKIQTYSDEIRLGEGALYVKLTLSFTEDIPKDEPYELIGEVDFETHTVTHG